MIDLSKERWHPLKFRHPFYLKDLDYRQNVINELFKYTDYIDITNLDNGYAIVKIACSDINIIYKLNSEQKDFWVERPSFETIEQMKAFESGKYTILAKNN